MINQIEWSVQMILFKWSITFYCANFHVYEWGLRNRNQTTLDVKDIVGGPNKGYRWLHSRTIPMTCLVRYNLDEVQALNNMHEIELGYIIVCTIHYIWKELDKKYDWLWFASHNN